MWTTLGLSRVTLSRVSSGFSQLRGGMILQPPAADGRTLARSAGRAAVSPPTPRGLRAGLPGQSPTNTPNLSSPLPGKTRRLRPAHPNPSAAATSSAEDQSPPRPLHYPHRGALPPGVRLAVSCSARLTRTQRGGGRRGGPAPSRLLRPTGNCHRRGRGHFTGEGSRRPPVARSIVSVV